MRWIYIISLLLFISSAQAPIRVTPKNQSCECAHLLNQADCLEKDGCHWNYTVLADLNNQTLTPDTSLGNCVNATLIKNRTYCSDVVDIKICSSTIGCAYLNNTCTIFAGCSAYVQTTNDACQVISIQCTTDGTRCITPTACSFYATEELCTKNVASSGAKSCNWNVNGTCEDKKCSDAPSSYKTQAQCNSWMAGCQSNGVSCTEILSPCSQYQQTNKCKEMIGQEGPCTNNSESKSCRPLLCSDAPLTYSTNKDCDNFLKGCLTNGRGCVLVLSSCYLYNQAQNCGDLIGSDGKCIDNKATGSETCKPLDCTDAPTTTNTNASCSEFLFGCVTTGQGCTMQLGTCSFYQGTIISCSYLVGTDGRCKGINSQVQNCQPRKCEDAPSTLSSNGECYEFQFGCITTGAGCTSNLSQCQNYTGTYTTCQKYIGKDGNCTAPLTQIEKAQCLPKICSDAPSSFTTNKECYEFSYLCVTNGAGCTVQSTCEATSIQTACQGQSNCSFNQICLNRTQCTNYLTQSQCLLNQQQYISEGNTYSRPCQWNNTNQKCQNIVCSSLSNSLITDQDCNSALQGCLTKYEGCVDISDPCTKYLGLTLDCQRFKGANGSTQCSQLKTVIDPKTPCVPVSSCSDAKKLGFVASKATCSQLKCYFDGKDNCTYGDCTTYYGTQSQCDSIATAYSSTPYQQLQRCWKTQNLHDAQTPCEAKLCSQAPSSYLTDNECIAFLKTCVWNGLDTGGCIEKPYECKFFTGSFSRCSTLQTYSYKCTKTDRFCKPLVCTNKIPPPKLTTSILKGIYCQGYKDRENGYNCQMGLKTCVIPPVMSCTLYIAVGEDNATKASYCQGLTYPGNDACGYQDGDYCYQAACEQFSPQGQSVDDKVTYCKGLVIDGKIQCGLTSPQAIKCSIRECSDYGLDQNTCSTYTKNCGWNKLTNSCYAKEASCDNFIIPLTFRKTELLKAQYCGSVLAYSQIAENQNRCIYQSDTSITCSSAFFLCTYIKFPPSIVSDQDRLNFCINSTCINYPICAYSTHNINNCQDISQCDKYMPYQDTSPSDVENQIFCQKQKTYDNKVCGFTSGNNKCVQPQPNCSDYNTYGKSIAENLQFCSQLTETSNNNKCVSYTAGPSRCKNQECEDITSGQSFVICSQYNKQCTFDGQVCVQLNANCSGYKAQVFGQGAQYNCAALQQVDGTKCGWTIGANCSIRTCTQLKGSDASAKACESYLTGCQYDGESCVDNQKSCTLYTPKGQSDTLKASICNAMNSIISQFQVFKCTFIVGEQTCITAVNECYYPIAYGLSKDEGTAICSLAQNQNGYQCGFNLGNYYCSSRNCNTATKAINDEDCNTFSKGCDLDDSTPCTEDFSNLIDCYKAPKSFITDSQCYKYSSNCLTSGAGCVDIRQPCSYYKGTQEQCNKFKGDLKRMPCTNYANASQIDNCIDRTCDQNKTAQNDIECDNWIPRIHPSYRECVWGGNLGCTKPQPCQQFTGTIDSCPTYIATDGPCFGAGSFNATCAPTTSLCTAAPKSYNTDQLCRKWGLTCITNGIGCISRTEASCKSMQTLSDCKLNKNKNGLSCDIALSCTTKPTNCDDFDNAIECNLTQQEKYDIICGWDAFLKKCIFINCDLLPITLGTDDLCRSVISTCTTNGAGCVTKGACSTYNKQACGVASTTDIQKKCIWQNSACRPIECTDNTTATTESECNQFLAGCRSTGVGCLSKISCSNITKQQLCLQDSDGYPCLWFYKSSSSSGGICITYQKCPDILSSTHSECQAASKLCTTNGITCVAITSCQQTLLQASCIIGTDGQCGWMPTTGSSPANCQLFTYCSAALGSTHEQCQQWGSDCITDGKVCVEKSNCASYQTQIACDIGIDGICYWDQIQGFCRTKVCSDATTNINTHQGCVSFKASTACTTTGSSCIAQQLCSLYRSEIGCFQGTDGVCWWETEKQVCRLKQCQDNLFTKSSACKQDIPSLLCVSNGVNCIPKSTCSTYTSREACIGGGSDGVCVFTTGTNSTTPNIGTCAQFSNCSVADKDQMTCNSRSDACYFNSTVINGTTITKCQPHTCSTKAIGSYCQPVPSWDLSYYQICVQVGSSCTEGNPNQLTSQTCYNRSVGTYTWNQNTSVCTICQGVLIINNTNDNQGYLLIIFLGIIFIA